MPLRPRRGCGCRALRSPGTNTGRLCLGVAAGPLLLFSWSTLGYPQELNTATTTTKTVAKEIDQASATGVCLFVLQISQQAKISSSNLSCTDTMLKGGKLLSYAGRRLRASAHPSPSPFRTSGLGRKLSYLTKSKWRRGEGGVSKNPASPHSSTLAPIKLHTRLHGC